MKAAYGKVFATLMVLLVLLVSQWAQAQTGHEIMERVEDNQRAISDAAFNRIQLSSCRFGIQNSQITCAEQPRVKALDSVGINTGADGRDTQTVTIIREPAAERGIGMLSYAYDDPAQENETWLYLSALGQVRRIASGNSDEDSEPASIFGSEFSTEDQDTGKLDDYTIRVLEETESSGRAVWKIEAIPNEQRARASRYARIVHYVDQERFVVLRSEMYDRQEREIKRLLASRVEQVNDIWVARSLTMLNLVSNRLSNMAILEIHTQLDVRDNFLTPRTLTDVAFREAELQRLRSQID